MRKLLFILLLGISCSSFAQLDPALDARLQFVLDSVCNKFHIKGASAAVLMPNKGIWKGAYGESYTGNPITTDMQFGIGSNTKTYIAALMLLMQQNGQLDLDDTIGTWIQNQPNINGQVTIRQLLRHQSGIYNFTNNPAFTDSLNQDFTRVWQPEELLQFIQAPTFAPGTNWEYSNSNYIIAGLIIKDVLNMDVSAALRTFIFKMYGLNSTVFFPEEPFNAPVPHVWSMHFPQPYLEDITVDYNYDHTAMFSMGWAAGAIMSTAEDNVKFWSNLMRGNIITNASLEEMKECVNISPTRDYGLGIFRTKYFNNRTVYGHGGTNIGFINENIVDTISGNCISVLTNQDSVLNGIILGPVLTALHKVLLSPLAVEDVNSAPLQVSVYPNPASGSVKIDIKQPGDYKVVLSDMTGRVVLSKTIHDHTNISLQGLNAGMYLVTVSNNDGAVYNCKLSVY